MHCFPNVTDLQYIAVDQENFVTRKIHKFYVQAIRMDNFFCNFLVRIAFITCSNHAQGTLGRIRAIPFKNIGRGGGNFL